MPLRSHGGMALAPQSWVGGGSWRVLTHGASPWRVPCTRRCVVLSQRRCHGGTTYRARQEGCSQDRRSRWLVEKEAVGYGWWRRWLAEAEA